MKNIYVTVISLQHMAMGLALAKALNKFGKLTAIYCIDDEAADELLKLNLKNTKIYYPYQFENSELTELKKIRSIPEFCWTCKSFILLHILKEMPSVDWAIYLDSDMMIYGDPDKALPDYHEVLLTPHNFSSEFKHFEDNAGNFNAGYIAFKNSNNGLNALSWWREKCIESCSAVPVKGLYGDQVYLNKMSSKFPFVNINSNPGINAGPWNILDKVIRLDGDNISIGGHSLLIYHMQGFKLYNFGFVNLYDGEIKIPKNIKDLIYTPYLKHLNNIFSIFDKEFTSPLFINILKPKIIAREIKRKFFKKSNMHLDLSKELKK